MRNSQWLRRKTANLIYQLSKAEDSGEGTQTDHPGTAPSLHARAFQSLRRGCIPPYLGPHLKYRSGPAACMAGRCRETPTMAGRLSSRKVGRYPDNRAVQLAVVYTWPYIMRQRTWIRRVDLAKLHEWIIRSEHRGRRWRPRLTDARSPAARRRPPARNRRLRYRLRSPRAGKKYRNRQTAAVAA